MHYPHTENSKTPDRKGLGGGHHGSWGGGNKTVVRMASQLSVGRVIGSIDSVMPFARGLGCQCCAEPPVAEGYIYEFEDTKNRPDRPDPRCTES